MQPFVEWLDSNPVLVNSEVVEDGKFKLWPHDRRILQHCLTPREDGTLPYTMVILSRPKKGGKTATAAAIALWYANQSKDGTEIYSLANDQDQAEGVVMRAIKHHVMRANIGRVKNYEVAFPNGTTIKALSSAYKSAAGTQVALSIWDELHAYNTEGSLRLWSEMTNNPTIKNPMRLVVTYAGHEDDEPNLLYDLYKEYVLNGIPVPELEDIVDLEGKPVCFAKGRVFVCWDTVPRYPWQTDAYYDDEMAVLRPAEFLRMHRNQWVTSEETFIPIEWWDRAVAAGGEIGLTTPVYLDENSPLRELPIVLAVDIGVKQDTSAVIGCYYSHQRSRVGLACHKVWDPRVISGELDLEETVEAYILEMWKKLPNITKVVCDPTNFHRSLVTLQKRGIVVERFEQSPKRMTAATENLFDLLKNGVFEAYPAPDMREHIKYSVAKFTGQGYRIYKEKNAKHKIDAAVALAMAAYESTSRGRIDMETPIVIRSRLSDFTAMRPAQTGLPWPFNNQRNRIMGDGR